jgi:hypothetical protein
MKRLLGIAAVFVLAGSAFADQPAALSLTPPGFGDAHQPQLAVSPTGEIFVVFGREESIYFEKSTDHGKNFSAPERVANVSNMPIGLRRGPRIAASAKRLVITAPSSDLVSFISDDDGATWSSPLTVNDKSTSAREGLDNITALPDGGFYAVWLDDRTSQKVVEGARLDTGATAWNPNVVVYQSPEKTVCECCHPSVVADATGKITVMWRNSLEGNRDFYIAASTDKGDTFSAAEKLGTGSWKLNACPMDGGNLIAGPAGIVTVWRRQNGLFIDKPGEPETKLATGMQPVVTRLGNDLMFAWQDKGQIMISRDAGKTTAQTYAGSYLSAAASPDATEAYLVWENAATPQFAVIRQGDDVLK